MDTMHSDWHVPLSMRIEHLEGRGSTPDAQWDTKRSPNLHRHKHISVGQSRMHHVPNYFRTANLRNKPLNFRHILDGWLEEINETTGNLKLSTRIPRTRVFIGILYIPNQTIGGNN